MGIHAAECSITQLRNSYRKKAVTESTNVLHCLRCSSKIVHDGPLILRLQPFGKDVKGFVVCSM